MLACEVMKIDDAIRNLIREGKTPQIQNAIQTNKAAGNILMDRALQNLYRSGAITLDTMNGAMRGSSAAQMGAHAGPSLRGTGGIRDFGR